MRKSHGYGILETLTLGHAHLACALLTSTLKGMDRLLFQIDCSGPIKGLSVECNAFGHVCGYLKQNPIPIVAPPESFDLSPFFGAGFLTLTKYLQDAKNPFTGKVMLEHGSIAKDLANYFFTSEQLPTAFSLSVQFDNQGNVTGAGGLYLQAMPGADPLFITELEESVGSLPSIGSFLANNGKPENYIREYLLNYLPEFLGEYPIEFKCHCSYERTMELLKLIPQEEFQEILANGPFPVVLTCQKCSTKYSFDKKALMEIGQQ